MIDKQRALIISILHQPTEPGSEAGEKIGREAFVYLDGYKDDYAQCSSCYQFNPEKKRCAILGPDFEVLAEATCCLYVPGEPDKSLALVARMTPEEAGYLNRDVRCENCTHSKGDNTCNLFDILNKRLPRLFNLDIRIEEKGCCNAWVGK